MIDIIKDNSQLLLKYQTGYGNPAWVDEKLKESGTVTLSKVFTFSREDSLSVQATDESLETYPTLFKDSDSLYEQSQAELFTDEDSGINIFILGYIEGKYYRIKKDILGLKNDLSLFKDMELNCETFVAHRNISIFLKIDKLIDEQIIIGGDADGAIPLEEFEYLLHEFPTSTELNHYTDSRITRILKDYFNTMSDAQQKLSAYLEKRGKRLLASVSEGLQKSQTEINQLLAPYEQEKFIYIRDELKLMLDDWESYNEHKWRDLVTEFLCLIFPKYIAILKELQVKDYYTNLAKPKNRKIDIALVDANGTLDIIEIKKPFPRCILSPKPYSRDNYIPKQKLSEAVMQVEKYIFHLNKWGREGEKEIEAQARHKVALPTGFKINITNPKGMILLGRDDDFGDEQQRFDFEIIRRKYANLIDILTYDDLLRRLNNIITMLGHPISPTETRRKRP